MHAEHMAERDSYHIHKKTKTIASNFVTKNKGATSIIFNLIKELMNYSTTSASSKI